MIKRLLGFFLLGILLLLSVITFSYAVGYHPPSDIINGTFTSALNFSSLPIYLATDTSTADEGDYIIFDTPSDHTTTNKAGFSFEAGASNNGLDVLFGTNAHLVPPGDVEKFNSTSPGSYLRLGRGGQIYLGNAGSSDDLGSRLMISPEGYIGINTTSPNSLLSISAETSGISRTFLIAGDTSYFTGSDQGSDTGALRLSYDGASQMAKLESDKGGYAVSGPRHIGLYTSATSSGSAATLKMQITGDGDAGILDGAFCIGDDDGSACAGVGSPTDGTLYYDTSTSSFDLAEEFYTVRKLEKAEVVIAAGDQKVDRSSIPFDTSVIGVVATSPNIVFTLSNFSAVGNHNASPTNTTAPITLTGRVPLKVTSENGFIEAGDLLTTSSTPGHAMRFTLRDEEVSDLDQLKELMLENTRRNNAILGKALENCYNETCEIVALINLQ